MSCVCCAVHKCFQSIHDPNVAGLQGCGRLMRNKVSMNDGLSDHGFKEHEICRVCAVLCTNAFKAYTTRTFVIARPTVYIIIYLSVHTVFWSRRGQQQSETSTHNAHCNCPNEKLKSKQTLGGI